MRRKAASINKKQEQERVHWLVTTGVKPGENTAQLQAASSCTAASLGEIHILKILLEHGADIHQRISFFLYFLLFKRTVTEELLCT